MSKEGENVVVNVWTTERERERTWRRKGVKDEVKSQRREMKNGGWIMKARGPGQDAEQENQTWMRDERERKGRIWVKEIRRMLPNWTRLKIRNEGNARERETETEREEKKALSDETITLGIMKRFHSVTLSIRPLSNWPQSVNKLIAWVSAVLWHATIHRHWHTHHLHTHTPTTTCKTHSNTHTNKHGHTWLKYAGKTNINEDGKTSEHGSRERAWDEEY